MQGRLHKGHGLWMESGMATPRLKLCEKNALNLLYPTGTPQNQAPS